MSLWRTGNHRTGLITCNIPGYNRSATALVQHITFDIPSPPPKNKKIRRQNRGIKKTTSTFAKKTHCTTYLKKSETDNTRTVHKKHAIKRPTWPGRKRWPGAPASPCSTACASRSGCPRLHPRLLETPSARCPLRLRWGRRRTTPWQRPPPLPSLARPAIFAIATSLKKTKKNRRVLRDRSCAAAAAANACLDGGDRALNSLRTAVPFWGLIT